MAKNNISRKPLPAFTLWEKTLARGMLLDIELEITARCNNNCKHCYINVPTGDAEASKKELPLEELSSIADEAVSLGALSCLITGGEPLLREDFPEIYLALKKKGLLVSVFTNATLIKERHITLFKKYPPREIEVSVYGATRETYEKITRKPGSFDAFMRGLDMLLSNGLDVRLKAVALHSNFHEMPMIGEFCRKRTKDYFRFDPLINLRFDRDEKRNEEIKSERLLPEEIATLEQEDKERFNSIQKNCNILVISRNPLTSNNRIFMCGAGQGSCYISYDGTFRLCSSLLHPDCLYDLKKGSLKDAYTSFVAQVRDLRSVNRNFFEKCRLCELVNLCLWCPGHAYLETGKLDEPVDYFCSVARARASNIKTPCKDH